VDIAGCTKRSPKTWNRIQVFHQFQFFISTFQSFKFHNLQISKSGKRPPLQMAPHGNKYYLFITLREIHRKPNDTPKLITAPISDSTAVFNRSSE
jgi:hypothetical protein